MMTFCSKIPIWVFPKIEVPQNAWFIIENPIKMDDLGDRSLCGDLKRHMLQG